MATMHRMQLRPARPRDAPLPLPRQLEALGTVLCLYRPQPGGELAGWTQAMAASAGSGLDSEGLCEQLRFFDRDGRCCWQLCLLPDSDFLAWEGVVASLPRDDLGGAELPPMHDRLWQRLAGRLRGEHWQASVLRLHAVHHDGNPALAASLASVSLLGAAVARRLARAQGAQGEAFVDDCCCHQAALAASDRGTALRAASAAAQAPIFRAIPSGQLPDPGHPMHEDSR